MSKTDDAPVLLCMYELLPELTTDGRAWIRVPYPKDDPIVRGTDDLETDCGSGPQLLPFVKRLGRLCLLRLTSCMSELISSMSRGTPALVGCGEEGMAITTRLDLLREGCRGSRVLGTNMYGLGRLNAEKWTSMKDETY